MMTSVKNLLTDAHALEIATLLRPANPSGLVRAPVYSHKREGAKEEGAFAPLIQNRYINSQVVPTVLLDSVESQANRQEMALYRHVPGLPDVVIELSDGRRVSQYEAPGRILDGLFYETTLNGTPFNQTPLFQGIAKGGEVAERILFRHSPLTLIYGGWLSFVGISMPPKWSRLIAVEILGLRPVKAYRTSSRLDPLGIPRNLPLPKALKQRLEAQKKKGKLSEAGLGHLRPTVAPMDVAVEGAVLVGAVSLTGLRALRLPLEAQQVLLTLILLGLALQHREGYRLRSGADLIPEEGCFKVRVLPGGEGICLEMEPLMQALQSFLAELPEDLRWPKDPLVLKANNTLEKLYKNALMDKTERAAEGQNKAPGSAESEGTGEE